MLYRAIGDLLPEGMRRSRCPVGSVPAGGAAQRSRDGARGLSGAPHEAADALFDAMLAAQSGVVFAVDEWDEKLRSACRRPTSASSWRCRSCSTNWTRCASEPAPTPSAQFPFVLSAGERRSFTANTIIRNPGWRKKDRDGALRMHPEDAARAGLVDGGRARLTTRGGAAEVHVEISDRMQPGHISLPNGLGLDFPAAPGEVVFTGVALNELTRGEDRDAFAGTPWHKHTPARVEALNTGS